MSRNEEASRLILRELERAGVTVETEQMLDRLEGRRITPEKELPKMEFLFRLFHKPCFPRGELVALSGKAKSGKTFVSSILMALCQRSPVLSLERIEPKRLRVLWYDIGQKLEFAVDDDGLPYLCSEEQLLEAQYNAQRKVADQMQRLGGTARLAPFNPRYVLGKENRKTVFDLTSLFAACMVAGQAYAEDELRTLVGREANIATDKVLREQLELAVSRGIIMQSYDGCQRRIYLRPVVQAEIPFE